VVAGVDYGGAAGFKTVAERKGRVIQVAGGDTEIIDFEFAFHQIVIADSSPELLHRDREVCVLHLSCQGFADRLVKPLWPVNVPFIARYEQRTEEG